MKLQKQIIEDDYDADYHLAHADIKWKEQPEQAQDRTPFQSLKKTSLDDIKNSRFLSYLLSSNSLNLLSLLRMSSTSTTFLLATVTSTCKLFLSFVIREEVTYISLYYLRVMQ